MSGNQGGTRVASADSATTPLVAGLRQFGIAADVVRLAVRHCAETDQYPRLGAGAADRLKVFLDLKDWVSLAKARLGRPQRPEDARVYDALRSATASGEVLVPLTVATYLEVGRISSLRQRTDLADVIAEISGFVSIAAQSVLIDHQLRTALADRLGGPPPTPVQVFGLGNPFGVARQKALVLRRKGGGALGLPAGVVREIETAGRVIGEYLVLRGPAPEDCSDLDAVGHRPEDLAKVDAARAGREVEFAAMLADGRADRDRLGDIVHARYLYWELGDQLPAAIRPYGLDAEGFFAKGKDWVCALLDDIPSAAVTITLSDKGFRNSYKKWTGNDIRDADAVSAAIPYCDVVMTDKYVAAQLAKSPAVTRSGTLVLSRLSDLEDALAGLLSSRAAR